MVVWRRPLQSASESSENCNFPEVVRHVMDLAGMLGEGAAGFQQIQILVRPGLQVTPRTGAVVRLTAVNGIGVLLSAIVHAIGASQNCKYA